MEAVPFYQSMIDRLSKSNDLFESEIVKLISELSNGEKVKQFRQDAAAEGEVALNAKGLERAELSLACALALGSDRASYFEACRLLESLIDRNCAELDIAYFWLAIARFHLGEFRESRLCCEKLLLRKPDNVLGRRLLELVRERVKRNGLSGLAIVFGVAVVSALAGSMFGAMRRAQ